MALTCKHMTPHGQQLDAAYVKAGIVQISPLTKVDTVSGIESNHFVLSCQLNVFADETARTAKRPAIHQVQVVIEHDTERPVHAQVYAAAKALRLFRRVGQGDDRRDIDEGPVFVDAVDDHG